MIMRFLIFITVSVAILGLAGFYLGFRFISWSQWAMQHRREIWLTLIIFLILQILGPLLYRVYPDKMNQFFIFQWVTYITLGSFFCMLFYAVAADALISTFKLIFNHSNEIDLHRRGFLTVGVMAAGTVAIGTYQGVTGPRVYKIDIPIKNLPEEFVGFKIVQISDLHIGPLIGKGYTKKVVELANKLDADIVALTGDIIDGEKEFIKEAVNELSKLKSKQGMFCVTGNHEYYWGIENSLEAMKSMGVKVLLNEHVVIQKNQSQIVLAGVTDYNGGYMVPSHKSDPHKAILNAPKDCCKIVLAHQPASYKATSQVGFDLQLSGHTHGGQFFPWSIVVALAQRYYKGLNKHEDMWVYVNRGTGYWGPPLRFAIPSEISEIRLVKA